MRLFIAILLDENMIDSLTAMQDEIMGMGVSGSYTRPENMHMTLAFIGEYDDPEGIVEIIKKVPFKSFDIKVNGYKPFKDMFFANIEENESLHDFVKRLRHALVENDIPFDRKKFMPHITLARHVKGGKDMTFTQDYPDEESMRVRGISLMKSERGKHGQIYTELDYIKAF